MKVEIYSNKEIIEKIKALSGSETGSRLAEKLGTARQNIRAYENKETKDLNNRIISYLLTITKK